MLQSTANVKEEIDNDEFIFDQIEMRDDDHDMELQQKEDINISSDKIEQDFSITRLEE